ncbi:hypothetical protein C8Q70DRAFT_128903 [Cubamyces menziesii]|uniref:C2H2-type domain-containing protein n=1 Tax=Trametes cubensis TaxID=1111947 RepID=A0AAD7TWG9_9APHY|nr:hypothetical protein C8Q70DRAFT_128903 [Cubamyces menziesii]KAJ8482494.1 hypothetical protein ONZ51_g5338 [Trametes cubensis]
MSYQNDKRSDSDNTLLGANINNDYIYAVYANHIPSNGSFAHIPDSSSAPASQQQQLEGGHQGGWHTHIHRPLATTGGHGMYTEHQCYPYGTMGTDAMIHHNEMVHGRNEHVGFGQHGTTSANVIDNRYIPAHPTAYRTTPNPNMQQPLLSGPHTNHQGVHAAYADAHTRAAHFPQPPSAPTSLTRSLTIDSVSAAAIYCQWAGGCGETITGGTPANIRGHLKDRHFMGAAPTAKTMLCCKWGDDCRRDPMQWENIPKHIAECHLKTMRRQCGDCGADFARSDTLTRHQQASSCPRGRATSTT